MSLTKKSDVENHLSSRHRRGIHLTPRASQPDATGLSGEQSDRTDPATGYVTEQRLRQPGIAMRVVPPIVSEPDLKPKRTVVNPHSVFLRKGCILPNRLDPLQEPIGDGWTMVADLRAFVFDTMIRQAGWHFMWLEDTCARRGFGMTRQSATDHALFHALSGISRRFNAAELDSVRVANFLGLHIVTVTLQPRQIQEEASLASDNAN